MDITMTGQLNQLIYMNFKDVIGMDVRSVIILKKYVKKTEIKKL